MLQRIKCFFGKHYENKFGMIGDRKVYIVTSCLACDWMKCEVYIWARKHPLIKSITGMYAERSKTKSICIKKV